MERERRATTQLPVPDFMRKSWEDAKRKEKDKLTVDYANDATDSRAALLLAQLVSGVRSC